MNFAFNEPVHIHLDTSKFDSDAETFAIAKIVAAHAEKRRAEYRLTEKKVKSLMGDEHYLSESVPWYEWMAALQVLQPCAEECGLKIDQLAYLIASKIKPSNWQVYSWMGMALQVRDYQEILTDQLSRHNALMLKKIVSASKRGKNAADALHNQPGGSREKRNAMRAKWDSGQYTSRDICAEQECAGLNMSFSAARKALRGTKKPT